ncbi:MAG: hypothetical protein AAB468_00505 [Patescibacteria group bacterium]
MDKGQLNVSLPVLFLREADQFIAYTPALDLSTSGGTMAQARKRFSEAVDIFFEETIKKNTLVDVLADLGWQKSSNRWLPPSLVGQSSQMVKIPLPA